MTEQAAPPNRLRLLCPGEILGRDGVVEFPFVIGVIGDFRGEAGEGADPPPPVQERKFLHLDADNFDDVLQRIAPRLVVKVANRLASSGGELAIDLRFRCLADFRPDAVVAAIPELSALLERRDALQSLIWKADRSAEIRACLVADLELARVFGLDTLSADPGFISRVAERVLATLDDLVSMQLNAVLHHPAFLKLEASWRGLHALARAAEGAGSCVVRIMHLDKKALSRSLRRSVSFDQNPLFKMLYDDEFAVAGGRPYGAIIGDYQWSHEPRDVDALRSMAQIASAVLAPFISGASESLFGMESWRELPLPRDLGRIFETHDYAAWRSLRDGIDSRFLVLTVARALARAPYRAADVPPWQYEEAPRAGPGGSRAMENAHYCWMNGAYVLGARMISTFARTGLPFDISGADLAADVAPLPVHAIIGDDGHNAVACPTEIGIGDRRERELRDLGISALIHVKNTDGAVFVSVPTLWRSPKFDSPAAAADARLTADLPYIMACARFVQHLMLLSPPRAARSRELAGHLRFLNSWIADYVDADEHLDRADRLLRPLRAASVVAAQETSGSDALMLDIQLRPWLSAARLSASYRWSGRIAI